jgi:tetratricopeptide (TPR) repeat protein
MTNDFPINDELSGQYLACHFRAALELPREAVECFREGVAQLQAGDPKSALAPLAKSIQYAPDFSDAHVFLGLANALTSNIYPAIDHLERATQLEPKSFAAQYALAQLNFKLRIPQKGYEAAGRALSCVRTIEQRKMLTDLLKEERARERNGIARPSFNKPFSRSVLVLAGSGLLVALVAIVMQMH